MISGPEVAIALYKWVCNKEERKRTQVERAANDLKEQILLEHEKKLPLNTNSSNVKRNSSISNAAAVNKTRRAKQPKEKVLNSEKGRDAESPKEKNSKVELTMAAADNNSQASSSGRLSCGSSGSFAPQQQIPSATLTNVTGSDLAKEVQIGRAHV